MMQAHVRQLLAAANEAGVWYGESDPGMGLTGWLVLGAVVAVIIGLCWLAAWGVRRSVSGEEARSTTRGEVRRLADGIMQTYRQ